MAEAFREVTDWGKNSIALNHTYLLEGDKALGYIKSGSEKADYFSKPLQLDKRGRKFVKLDVNPFETVAADPALIAVQGSKGVTYYIDPTEKTCTCPGFTFRGKCKHLETVK